MEAIGNDGGGFMNVLRYRWIQLSALTTLIASIGINELRLKFCVRDSDIWWHLKVGDWIIDHLVLPRTGILSRTVADHPWVAYSWGYEVPLSRAYTWFGLLGTGWYGVALTIGVAVALFWMLRRLSAQFGLLVCLQE